MKPIDKFLENAQNMKVNVDSVVWEEGEEIQKREVNKFDLHELRSCSKILIAMAYGIAINEKFKLGGGGYLTLESKVYSTLAKLTDVKIPEEVKEWTIRTLLTFTTGYEKMMMNASQVKDLDKSKLLDVIFSTSIKYKPNTHFIYNNVEPYLLSVFFQESFGINISDFINERIFKKLDIKNFTWTKYGKYCAGATGLFLNYEDFHKIGKLLFQKGMFNGTEVVPKAWVEEMTKAQVACPDYYKSERLLPKVNAGYFTWISNSGIVFRDGSNGQYIICDFSNDRLITIMATQKDMSLVTECLRGVL